MAGRMGKRKPAAKAGLSFLLLQKPMTLQSVLQFKAAEKAAKDAFYAQHAAEAKPGGRPSAQYFQLQIAMIKATKARQSAMTAYAASL